MTHDELKAKVFQEYATTYEDLAGNVPMSPKALLAVVELHKPVEGDLTDSPICDACSISDYEADYPCPTIQAIEKELK